MTVGRSGMGSHKHGVSGRSGKSPKMRQHMKREAEKANVKANPRQKISDPKDNVNDLFHKNKR